MTSSPFRGMPSVVVVLLLLSVMVFVAVGKVVPRHARDVFAKQLRWTASAAATLTALGGSGKVHASVPPPKEPTSLSKRVLERDSLTMEPGLLEGDVYYPPWLEGTWRTASTCTSVFAPLGIEAFGGERVWKAAQADLNQTLVYTTRFVGADQTGTIIADRLYNVESIARSAIGYDSILPSKQPDKNLARRLHVVMAPAASREIYDIDLYPTDRFSQAIDNGKFACFERTAQLISTRMEQLANEASGKMNRPFRKDIETISIYRVDGEGRVLSQQRTATFLTKADARFASLLSTNPGIEDHAIDIRLYDIVYERV